MSSPTSLLYLVAAALIIVISPVHATININVDAVQKTVVFIYAADASGAVDQNKPMGTAFLVGVPIKSDPKRFYPLLVTARHVFDPTWAKCGQANPSVVYARMNKKSYKQGSRVSGFDFVPIQLTDHGMPTWRHHTSNDIDAAVMQIAINQDQFDIELIPVELFPTDVEIAAQSIGDPVMSAGLLPSLAGNTRNQPIFKFGQISKYSIRRH